MSDNTKHCNWKKKKEKKQTFNKRSIARFERWNWHNYRHFTCQSAEHLSSITYDKNYEIRQVRKELRGKGNIIGRNSWHFFLFSFSKKKKYDEVEMKKEEKRELFLILLLCLLFGKKKCESFFSLKRGLFFHKKIK